ncbi:MAG TPA: MFS transporter [Streptosporangiaceae bacterium]|nr:MFS transporter [Streptosporangiaceae bacterium]
MAPGECPAGLTAGEAGGSHHDLVLADCSADDVLTGRRRLATLLFVTGITALAFNLRPAITSLPPVFPELASQLGLSSAALTALATIPVVCFGVFSGVAARLSRGLGDERALFVSLIVVTVGLALRGAFPHVALFPATALAAAAIAIMNVLLPGLIKRRMPQRAGLLIGIYLLSLSVGAIIGSLISVPIYHGSGGSSQLVLGLWALPAAVAAVMWLPQLRRRRTAATLEETADARVIGRVAGRRSGVAAGRSSAGHAVHRHLLGWQVAGFMGLQSLTYYATLSWLPSLFRERGASPAQAGVLISVAALGGAVTSLVVPVLAHRATDQRLLVILTVLVSGVGIAAAGFAPMSMATFWMFVLGLGQGAALGLAIFFTMARAATPEIAASLSSLAQSAGYLLASTGPLLVGFLHTATGTWTVPIVLLIGFTVMELFTGYLAARARVIA